MFNLLTGISAILFLATAGLWTRTHSRTEQLTYFGRSGAVDIIDFEGGLRIFYRNLMSNNPQFEYSASIGGRPVNYANLPWMPHTFWHRLGFSFEQHTRPRDKFRNVALPPPNPPGLSWPPVVYSWEIVLPLWLPLLLAATLPLWNSVALITREVNRPPGHCPGCGYDLRATPDRCPECGKMLQKVV